MKGQVDHVATQRKKDLKKYFVKSPDPFDRVMALTLLAVAGVCAVAGVATLGYSRGIGAGALVIGVAGGITGAVLLYRYKEAYARSEPKPSDAAMDKQLADDLLRIQRTAMESLNLTAEDLETGDNDWDPIRTLSRGETSEPPGRRPILIYGPSAHGGYTVGADEVWRFESYEVMVICPTHHHLAIHRSELDLLTGKLFLEETQEYQYAHVASVSTVTVAAPEDFESRRTDVDPPPERDRQQDDSDRERRNGRSRSRDDDEVRHPTIVLRQFTVGVSSGLNTSVTVGVFDRSDPGHGTLLPDHGIRQTIASIRRVLRDKNGGAVGSPGQGVY